MPSSTRIALATFKVTFGIHIARKNLTLYRWILLNTIN